MNMIFQFSIENYVEISYYCIIVLFSIKKLPKNQLLFYSV